MRGLHLFFVAASLFVSLECGNDSETCDGGACTDASVPAVSGGGCDTSKPASQGGCAVDDTDGYFVSPAGSDTAAGSKVAPFATIGKGIAAAAGDASKPNVYVCQGTYAENLVIQGAPAGVALHGGFDCATWTESSAPVSVAPASGLPLHVLGAAALVESMTLTAADATDPGGSSIAALVDGSPGMTFRRARVASGKGMAGATPTPPPVASAAANGNNGAQSVFAFAKSCACTNDVSVGGQGGGYLDGGVLDPEAGAPTIAADPDAGQPGISAGPPQCNGGTGADGPAGKAGSSTGTLGELTANGWIPSPGGAGGAGSTAQGGGGGFYNIGSPIFCGGSGACGGCGGAGGAGGGGGGASIAIVGIDSTMRVQASMVQAGSGGNGGNGSLGQAGQPGGTGGTGSPCNGGPGGTGGAGGPGGGGAGGISVAIATNGTPDIDSSSSVLAGAPGQGGLDGSGASKAIDGIAGATHKF